MTENTSASGGYLRPSASINPPLEGDALEDFVHDMLVGITGLANEMVRPRWQPDPANIPTAGTVWCAFGFGTRTADTFPYIGHDPEGDADAGVDQLQRHETLPVIVSFYDLGAGGEADAYCAILRDGLAIAQNREVLTANGFGLVGVDDAQPVPTILSERWLYRVDLNFKLRRNIVRQYRVENFASAEAELIVTDDFSVEITVEEELP